MSELSEKEEISGSVAQKHPRGSPRVQVSCLSNISTIFYDKNIINENYFTGRLYRIQPPLISITSFKQQIY